MHLSHNFLSQHHVVYFAHISEQCYTAVSILKHKIIVDIYSVH